jgi:hypothetical protein
MFFSRTVVSAVFRQRKSFGKALASNAMPFFRYSDNRKKSNMTIETAKSLPKEYDEYPNDVIITMAVMGDQGAREERLVREIMAVDEVAYEVAQSTLERIKTSNRKGLVWQTLPYKIGIATAVTAGVVSFPLIFHYDTVLWFNEFYVTCDVPEEKDLETPLEVGGFAWNWMEPPLGQVSFFLLCMQYSRAQLENLGIKPFTNIFKSRRAKRLHIEFPQYNAQVLTSFSEGDPLAP